MKRWTGSAAIRASGVLAATKLLVHLIWLRPYGYFCDELYYLACGQHLALGYVDHPPFSVAFLAMWREVFGASLAALRVPPAIAGAAVVLLTGFLVDELGGGAVAALLAGAAVLASPAYLAVDHFYSMNAFDEVFWAAAALLALRALRGGGRATRPWIALGVVLGLGLLNKWSVMWLALGLVVGVAVTSDRRVFATRGPYLAAGIAALLFAPNLAWQALHGWPTLEFMRNAMELKYVPKTLGSFVGDQLVLAGPLGVGLALTGCAWSWRPGAANGVRLLGAVFVTTLVIIVASRSAKSEYMIPAYALAFTLGGLACERAFARAPRVATAAALSLFLVQGALAAPLTLAVLPEEAFIRYARVLHIEAPRTEKKKMGALPQHFADMHGWPELVAALAGAYAKLPDDERAHAGVWTRSGGYAPAGAVDLLGGAYGLPRAISGHNSYWTWGPAPPDVTSFVVLGGGRERLERLFDRVEEVSTFECGPYCMPYRDHLPIYLAHGLKGPLADAWPDEKNYE
jgi:dolichyl-phosphate-mannose-protein mannosyltransferase